MIMNFGIGGNKSQAFYILWVLEHYSDENHFLKQDDIVEILKKNGHITERKSVGRDLTLLAELGFNIHGVLPELDDDGNELPIPRGKIWLEREISDEKLKLLIDSILFSNYIGKEEARDLIDALISLGSAKLKAKSATSRIDGGRVYHQENANFFKELWTINEAMIEVNGESKRINFKYAQYKYKGDEIKLEKEKDHVVSPYFFVSQKGNYYLVGYNHKQECLWHYRMDYVKDVKILKDTAKKKEETELKGKDIGEYVTEHPYMFSGEPQGIVVKVPTDRLGIIKDSFGNAFTRLSADEDYITARIYCNELGAFHWAMQYGTYIEVLSPQPLRDRIRYHVEGMAMKYLQYDGDRYSEAIKATKNNGDLDLTGIKIGSRTKHLELDGLKTLRLSDNKISDISFVKNYKKLHIIHITNNPITDISALAELDNVHTVWLENVPVKDLTPLTKMKKLKSLHLKLGRDVDYSVLNGIKTLEAITLPENDSYYLDWEFIQKNMPELDVRTTKYSPKTEAKRGGETTSPYPLILFKEALGYNIVLTSDEKTATKVADSVIGKLIQDEKKVATLYYKQGYNVEAISEDLSISTDEVNRILKAIKKKITHSSYNGEMEQYIAVAKPNSTNAMEKLKELVGIKD